MSQLPKGGCASPPGSMRTQQRSPCTVDPTVRTSETLSGFDAGMQHMSRKKTMCLIFDTPPTRHSGVDRAVAAMHEVNVVAAGSSRHEAKSWKLVAKGVGARRRSAMEIRATGRGPQTANRGAERRTVSGEVWQSLESHDRARRGESPGQPKSPCALFGSPEARGRPDPPPWQSARGQPPGLK